MPKRRGGHASKKSTLELSGTSEHSANGWITTRINDSASIGVHIMMLNNEVVGRRPIEGGII